jgi:hypothetical protein
VSFKPAPAANIAEIAAMVERREVEAEERGFALQRPEPPGREAPGPLLFQ